MCKLLYLADNEWPEWSVLPNNGQHPHIACDLTHILHVTFPTCNFHVRIMLINDSDKNIVKTCHVVLDSNRQMKKIIPSLFYIGMHKQSTNHISW